MTNQTTGTPVSKPVPAKKKLLSASAPFYFINSLDDCVCRVDKGAPLWNIAEELNHAIANVSHMLEAIEKRKNKIEGCEMSLMQARLDQAAGLCLSIMNTIEDIEEEEDLSNE